MLGKARFFTFDAKYSNAWLFSFNKEDGIQSNISVMIIISTKNIFAIPLSKTAFDAVIDADIPELSLEFNQRKDVCLRWFVELSIGKSIKRETNSCMNISLGLFMVF